MRARRGAWSEGCPPCGRCMRICWTIMSRHSKGREATADEDESFWEYIYPEGDRKCRKKIHKAQKVADYTQAVFQLLSGY